MTKKTIKNFIDEIFSKPPKQKYTTNKINVYHIDNIWNLFITDFNEYCPENDRGYR